MLFAAPVFFKMAALFKSSDEIKFEALWSEGLPVAFERWNMFSPEEKYNLLKFTYKSSLPVKMKSYRDWQKLTEPEQIGNLRSVGISPAVFAEFQSLGRLARELTTCVCCQHTHFLHSATTST